MGWLRGIAILVSGLGLMVGGCGSDSFGGTGQGTLQLVRFGSGATEQPDAVGATSAQVDVCQSLCSAQGGGGEIMFEPYSSTQVAAFVVNRGKSDITVDQIRVTYPNAGLIDLVADVAGGFAVPGGRCSTNSSVACASSFECGGAICVTQETAIPFTILSLKDKDLLGGTDCENDFESSIVTSFVTISGRDASGERFAISGGMNLEVANFDNCQTM